MKSKGKKNLTYTQRLILEDCLKAKLHKKVIADKLGVCLATVYNEIKRGQYLCKKRSYVDYWGEIHYKQVKAYSPNIAYEKYKLNMTSKGAPLKVGNDYDFVKYVEKRILQDKLSPCAVLGEIKRKKLFKTDISKTTMYRYVSIGIFENVSMSDLPMHKRKKHYRKAVAKRPPKGISIEKRPTEIAERNSFGHWEMDCVCGSTTSSLLVLSERLSRKEIIFSMPKQNCQCVIKCLNILERRFGSMFRKVFKSITVDNGSEFADSVGLQKSIYGGKRFDLFYCHPYSSCERATNERINRDIRRLIPKGSNIANYSNDYVRYVEEWVNDYPREIFNFATANDMFNQYVSAI